MDSRHDHGFGLLDQSNDGSGGSLGLDYTGLLGNAKSFGTYPKSNWKLQVEEYVHILVNFAGRQVKCLVFRLLEKM